MNNREKALNLLGMATRAGKIVSGEGLVLQDIRARKVQLVLLAEDASANTRKKLTDKCSHYQIPCYSLFTQTEISQAIGKTRMVCGVKDKGFAEKLRELISS
ncbi:YlxQ-related RNA-binding protein [Vagococcus elongatus]|uniref:50S ribosomal protein L7 n=1 Tax=Vagococcus elongatus TaxID=180344 RepID=A0A430ASL1_9ENTE|nr:YlxQ-related RNA-binding protein [Vagococcus elongatus]RSU11034.1 50S ribosomal protein L7 [Vagococcus elongatus]